MFKKLKDKAIDILAVVLIAVAVLGSFEVYSRIKAHNAMDAELIRILQSQTNKPAETP
jgi:hypothetical protein